MLRRNKVSSEVPKAFSANVCCEQNEDEAGVPSVDNDSVLKTVASEITRVHDGTFSNKRKIAKKANLKHSNVPVKNSDADSSNAATQRSVGNTGPPLLSGVDDSEPLQLYFQSRHVENLVLGAEEDLVDIYLSKGTTAKKNKAPKPRNLVPAWQDNDDINSGTSEKKVRLDNDFRRAKLAKVGEKAVDIEVYKSRLKTSFEQVHGAQPAWADLDAKGDISMNSDDDDDLYQRTGNCLIAPNSLPPTYLEFKPVSHANKAKMHKAPVSTVRFHPSSQVIMTAGKDNALSFFQVDGDRNELLLSTFVERFPIYCARFSADGSEVILGSKFKMFHSYDMIAGQFTSIQPIKGIGDKQMTYFEMSPCGKLIVFRGEYGHMHILSSKSKELIGQFKMNGSVEAMCFSSDGSKLFSFGDDGEVYVWDLNSRSCVHRFRDEGCLGGTSIATDPSSRYLACGSQSGVVNIYRRDDCLQQANPQPVKVVNNLLTTCTSMTFNPQSQVLAISSNCSQKAIRLINLSSQSVFQNFPSLSDKMVSPTDMDFSSNSGYLSVGTKSGAAHLYRLLHYTSY